jgi:CheY-like chemotaxis protein
MILEEDDHAVRIAQDGPSALQALTEFKPDVVLLDVGLPGMVARRMREETPVPSLTIIALSGSGETEDFRQSKQGGCDVHLVKPVHPNVLRKLLGAAPTIMSSI